MDKNLVASIGKAYNDALMITTSSCVEIAEQFRSMLSVMDVKERSRAQFDRFIKGLRLCSEERKDEFIIMNFCEKVIKTCMVIQIYMHDVHGLNLDISFSSRKKSLQSELIKLLIKAIKNDEVQITDRYGVRAIIMDDDISKLYKFANVTVDILTGLDLRERAKFEEWLIASPVTDELKMLIGSVIEDVPFFLEKKSTLHGTTKGFDAKEHPEIEIPEKSGAKYTKYCKDYIAKPKGNGYQSLHFTLRIGQSSNVLPGTTIEFQIRTYKQHKHATSGAADHWVYKASQIDALEEEISNIITVSHPELLNIRGFDTPKNPEGDIIGLCHSKDIYGRRLTSEEIDAMVGKTISF